MIGPLFIGYLVGSSFSGNTEQLRAAERKASAAQALAGDVYINIDAITRLRDPLKVKLSCTGGRLFYGVPQGEGDLFGSGDRKPLVGNYEDLFRLLQPNNANQYEILRITRVLSGIEPSAIFWFEYTEKDNLNPPQETTQT